MGGYYFCRLHIRLIVRHPSSIIHCFTPHVPGASAGYVSTVVYWTVRGVLHDKIIQAAHCAIYNNVAQNSNNWHKHSVL